MRICLALILLFSVNVFAKTPKEGVYLLTGSSTSGARAKYFGSVTLGRKGRNFELKWKIGPTQTQTGIAILSGDILSVGYFDDSGKDFGVVAYTVKSDKKLIGKWAPLGAADVGDEELEFMGEDNGPTWAKVEQLITDKSADLWSKKISLQEIEDKLLLETDPLQKFYLLSEIGHIYASDKIQPTKQGEAKERAEELLGVAEEFKGDWNYGNAIHHANLVLGRLKLLDGDNDGAKEKLKKAGQTPGSPQINSFGPNMTLAKELLVKGEKDAVLKYLEDVKKFWKSPNAQPKLTEWKRQVEEGKTPNFGANLLY